MKKVGPNWTRHENNDFSIAHTKPRFSPDFTSICMVHYIPYWSYGNLIFFQGARGKKIIGKYVKRCLRTSFLSNIMFVVYTALWQFIFLYACLKFETILHFSLGVCSCILLFFTLFYFVPQISFTRFAPEIIVKS